MSSYFGSVPIEILGGIVCVASVYLVDATKPFSQRITGLLVILGLLASRKWECTIVCLSGLVASWVFHRDLINISVDSVYTDIETRVINIWAAVCSRLEFHGVVGDEKIATNQSTHVVLPKPYNIPPPKPTLVKSL